MTLRTSKGRWVRRQSPHMLLNEYIISDERNHSHACIQYMHNETKRISFTSPGLSYAGSSLVQNAPRIRNKIVTFIDKGVSPACTTEKNPVVTTNMSTGVWQASGWAEWRAADYTDIKWDRATVSQLTTLARQGNSCLLETDNQSINEEMFVAS